jgi:ribosome biogenesis protein BRX1
VLVEIGPRFVLDIIKIFSKSLGGATLYSNPRYISPNLLRHELYKQQGSKYMARKAQESEREVRQEDLVIPSNPLDDVYKK